MDEQQCEKLIDKLADKSLGEIARMTLNIGNESIPDPTEYQKLKGRLAFLWRKCGKDKSLNQIMEESGFSDALCGYCGRIMDSAICPDSTEDDMHPHRERQPEELKDPNARALFEFLNDIFT